MAMKTKTDRAIDAARSAIKSTLLTCKDNVEQAKQRARNIRAARYVRLQPTLTRIFAILDDVKEDDKFIFVSSYGSVYVSLFRQDGFKVPHVVELLEYLSGMTDKTSSSDSAGKYSMSRTFDFSIEGMDVHVSVDVKSDSATCHKVVVGTTTEERVTYKIVCD